MRAASVSSPDSPVALHGQCSTPSSRPCSRVRHRGAVAADHRTGDGAGVLLPLPAALLPEPGLGLAMVFLRDPDGRRAVEEACRAEGIAVAAGGRCPWTSRRSAPRRRPPCRRSSRRSSSRPPVMQTRSKRQLSAPASVSTAAAISTSPRSRSARSSTRRSARPTSSRRSTPTCATRRRGPVRDLPPALLDEHRAVVGAAQPFRLLCHNGEINAIHGNVNWMRARALTLGAELGPVARRGELRLRRCSTTRSSCSCAAAATSAACAHDAGSARVAGRRRARAAGARLLPLPRGARRAVGRPGGRRLHRRTRRRRRARPQRAAAASLRRRRRSRRLRVRGRRRRRAGRSRRSARDGSGRARCSPSIRSAASRTTRRSSCGSRAAARTAAGSAEWRREASVG